MITRGPSPRPGEEPDPRARLNSRPELAFRLKLVRLEMYGQYGAPMLATTLGISLRVWLEAESRGAIAADCLLRFLVITSAHPHWLLTGAGPMYVRKGDSA